MITVDVAMTCLAWREAVPEVEALIQGAAGAINAEGEAAVLLTDNDHVRELNSRFRGKNSPTNVLSFPAGPNPMGLLGDVALAYGVCEGEARAQGKPLADHLRHLVVHGLLHLLGYDHEDDADGDVMEALERSILGRLGLPDPYRETVHDRLSAEP